MDLLDEEIPGELNASAFAGEVFGDDVEFFGADEGRLKFEREVGFDGRVVALNDGPGSVELTLAIGELAGPGEFLRSAAAIVDKAGAAGFDIGKEIASVGTGIASVDEQADVGGLRFTGGFF